MAQIPVSTASTLTATSSLTRASGPGAVLSESAKGKGEGSASLRVDTRAALPASARLADVPASHTVVLWKVIEGESAPGRSEKPLIPIGLLPAKLPLDGPGMVRISMIANQATFNARHNTEPGKAGEKTAFTANHHGVLEARLWDSLREALTIHGNEQTRRALTKLSRQESWSLALAAYLLNAGFCEGDTGFLEEGKRALAPVALARAVAVYKRYAQQTSLSAEVIAWTSRVMANIATFGERRATPGEDPKLQVCAEMMTITRKFSFLYQYDEWTGDRRKTEKEIISRSLAKLMDDREKANGCFQQLENYWLGLMGVLTGKITVVDENIVASTENAGTLERLRLDVKRCWAETAKLRSPAW